MAIKKIDWKKEEEKFNKSVKKIKVPNWRLSFVPRITLNRIEDFDKIPTTGGCYWIWTNEPVNHSFHKHDTPRKLDKGEIIYNGIAKDNINWRVQNHLYSKENEGWSGISMDIFKRKSGSHRKKAMSTISRAKVPYVNYQPIRDKEKLLLLRLTKSERDYITSHNYSNYYFRNGINIFERKHIYYIYKVYFIQDLSFLYLDYIEKKWRQDNNLPKLCSYSSGR